MTRFNVLKFPAVGLTALLGIVLSGATVSAPSYGFEEEAAVPIRLRTTDPRAKGRKGLLQDAGWSLKFRLEAPRGIGYIEIRESGFSPGGGQPDGSDFDLLLLSDPDDCLDLSDSGTVLGPVTPSCPGGADETFVKFRALKNASAQFPSAFCREPDLTRLTDTAVTELISQGGIVPFRDANKSYVPAATTSFQPFTAVGPFTENTGFGPDCYGYGASNALPSLVVMADIGGAQVFDTDLTYATDRIRNMAGLLTGVGYELLDRNGVTAITAELDVTERMLEPVILVDLGAIEIGIAAPYTDPSFVYRIADGPAKEVQLAGTFTSGEYLRAIQDAVASAYSVRLRAVVVEGPAPDFIDDLDGNGRFTAGDLTAAGYRLLSNQSFSLLNMVPRELLRQEEDSYECPGNLVFTDLDTNGQAGACQDGDGTSRSAIRVPR